MKMYKESLRKLAPVGIPLAVATLLYTLITNGQNCFGSVTISQSTSAVGLTPVLVYYVFTAVVFAFYGFFYQFKRSASDLYHSIPVSRLDLYLSVTLGTATWMGATIVLNVLLTLALYVIGGCPFVSAYIPLSILFYFVASMLVYAAAAIGCALSGTFLTAAASAGLVLFLPRFVQFIIARGIIAKVSIIGWMDVGALLNPMTNVATGLIVMQTRNAFITQIIALPNILYSLVPMALELALAAWLFMRRPSETADHGAAYKGWSIAAGAMLAFTLLLLVTVDSKPMVSVYGFAIAAISLLVYALYEYISLRNIKQTLKALPYFLLSAILAFCVSLGIQSSVSSALNFTPAPAEIASVSFRGHDTVHGDLDFDSIGLRKITFDNADLINYVSDNLSDAVQQVKANLKGDYSYSNTYDSSAVRVIEPVAIKLVNGGTVYRTIEFANVDTLNALRSENDAFSQAIRKMPDNANIQYRSSYDAFTKDELREIWASYTAEVTANNLVPKDYYRSHAYTMDQYGSYIVRGGDQQMYNISIAGYVGTQRFSDYVTVRLDTPQTASLVMRLCNAHAKEGTVSKLQEAVTHMLSPFALENDNLSISLNAYNVKLDEGDPANLSTGLSLSGTNNDNDTYAAASATYTQQIAVILARGTPTDDSSATFVQLNWSEYDSGNRKSFDYPALYLSFTPADQTALIKLLQDWNTYSVTGVLPE